MLALLAPPALLISPVTVNSIIDKLMEVRTARPGKQVNLVCDVIVQLLMTQS